MRATSSFKSTTKIITSRKIINLTIFNFCEACSLSKENMSVPQAAFAVKKIRQNMEKREHQYCQEERQEVSKYNSKYMNSIWGMYNRFSVHNLKKIMDFSAQQQPKVGLAAASQFSISVERLSYLPL